MPNDGTLPETTAPARFSLLGPAYAKKYGVDETELKDVLTRIAWKNHYNGARNSRAQFRKEVSREDRQGRPDRRHARCIRLLRRVRRLGRGHRGEGRGRPPLHRQPLYVKGLSFVAGPARGNIDPSYDFTTFPEVVSAAGDAYAQAGVKDRGPRSPWPRCMTASPRPSWS